MNKEQPKPQENKAKSVKIVLIGDSNVGKTSIIDMFVDSKFGETKPSIGALHKLKTIRNKNDEETQLDIWDTAGQERFRSIVPMYYKGAKGILVIYDITSKESFEGSKKWISEIESNNNSAMIFLVGNKKDLQEQREVTLDMIHAYCQSKGISHYECSAKTNENILDIFITMVDKIPKANESLNSSKLSLNNPNTAQSGGYCCS